MEKGCWNNWRSSRDLLERADGICWRRVTGTLGERMLEQLEKAHGTCWRKLTGPVGERSQDLLEKGCWNSSQECCLNIRMLCQGVPSSPCFACYKAMAASAAGNASHGNSQCDLYLPQGADVLLIEHLSLSITLCSYNECCHPLLFAENCLAYCFRPRCNSLSKRPRRLHV